MSEEEDFYLAHYGVKGMKWGVRKSKAEIARQRKNDRAKDQRKRVAQNRRLISSQDLDSYIARLEKEKKLKTLVDADTRSGRTFASSVMTQAGRTAATTIATGAMIYGVRAALQKNFSAREAASYLKPKK